MTNRYLRWTMLLPATALGSLSWTAWSWRVGAEISTGGSGLMTEAFVVYLLFVVLTGFFGQQQILGFSAQEACLTTRDELRQQGVPDISACIPLLIQGTPGTETPEDAAAMIQRPLQP